MANLIKESCQNLNKVFVKNKPFSKSVKKEVTSFRINKEQQNPNLNSISTSYIFPISILN